MEKRITGFNRQGKSSKLIKRLIRYRKERKLITNIGYLILYKNKTSLIQLWHRSDTEVCGYGGLRRGCFYTKKNLEIPNNKTSSS